MKGILKMSRLPSRHFIVIVSFYFLFLFFIFCLMPFLGPLPQHMEVPRLGVQLEP